MAMMVRRFLSVMMGIAALAAAETGSLTYTDSEIKMRWMDWFNAP